MNATHTPTMGSLFSGSGTFELAASINGMRPVWASEIEKYPIEVTSARFPDMKHLGDVTAIDGGSIDPVDVITFGSPCQDMSVAGKRSGLDGARSILFYEAIRIIREMRNATNGKCPRYAVWENVAGAFSSNKGWDFKAVLEAFCATGGYTDSLPEPDKRAGRLIWQRAGTIMGGGFSIAWRVLDAQYWGVPQRRRRIFLVADFAGGSAPEILFDPEGLHGDTAPGREARKGTAGDAAGGIGGGCWPGVAGSLIAGNGHAGMKDGVPDCVVVPEVFHSLTATNARCTESAQQPNCVAFMAGQGAKAHGIGYAEEQSPTLKAASSGTNQAPSVCYALQGNCIDRADTAGCNGSGWREDASYTLNTIDRHAVAIDARNLRVTPESGTLQAKTTGGHSLNYQNPVCYRFRGYGDYVQDDISSTQRAAHDQTTADMVVERKKRKYVVRRLTPVECLRLMGLPDGWGDIENKKLQSDSAMYKMCGNGVVRQCAEYVLRGIARKLRGEAHNE